MSNVVIMGKYTSPFLKKMIVVELTLQDSIKHLLTTMQTVSSASAGIATIPSASAEITTFPSADTQTPLSTTVALIKMMGGVGDWIFKTLVGGGPGKVTVTMKTVEVSYFRSKDGKWMRLTVSQSSQQHGEVIAMDDSFSPPDDADLSSMDAALCVTGSAGVVTKKVTVSAGAKQATCTKLLTCGKKCGDVFTVASGWQGKHSEPRCWKHRKPQDPATGSQDPATGSQVLAKQPQEVSTE
jgi:hypothetical protein